MFEAIERGEIKALWVMATNPAVSLPRAGAMRDALKKLELFVVSENVPRNDTVNAGAACAAARRRLGREGRHRHQLRAAHLAPAPLPAAAGRGAAGLVDRHARSRGAWATAAHSPIAAPPTFSASTPRCRRSRTTARAISISAGWRNIGRGLRRARAGAMAGASWQCRDGERGDTRFFADGRLLHPRPQGALHRARAACAARRSLGRISASPQHRPRARPVAHHDAHRVRARGSALHMPEPFVEIHPRRCRALGLATTASRAFAPRTARHLRVASTDGQQRGSLFVPIHWSDANRLVGARRRSGRAADRSVLRPARGQGDAGRDRAGRFALSRLCARPRAARARRQETWWARVALARLGTASCLRPTKRRWRWRDRASIADPQAMLDRIRRSGARHLSRRGVRRWPARRRAVRRPGRCAAAMGRHEGLFESGHRRPQRRMRSPAAPPTASPRPAR